MSGLPIRIGQGVDVHAFALEGQGLPLVLGGVTIPGGPGLAGHSDGDAVLHAVVDALLAAVGAGDIGTVFGTDQQAYAGADSAVFVAEAMRQVTQQGWAVGNLSCTVIAARPRLAPRRAAMAENVAGLLGIEPGQVNVAATTTDGLGWTGRGEGIACLAVVLLQRPDRP